MLPMKYTTLGYSQNNNLILIYYTVNISITSSNKKNRFCIHFLYLAIKLGCLRCYLSIHFKLVGKIPSGVSSMSLNFYIFTFNKWNLV